MKRTFFLAAVLLLLSQFTFSQDKTIIGLTQGEIAMLKKQNPGVEIDLNKYVEGKGLYFTSYTVAQAYIDSVKESIKAMIDVPEKQVQLGVSVNGRFAPCGCGDYIAFAGAAGLYTSFNLSFNYCDGAVSNASIGTSGIRIGWSLGSTTSSYNGLYGCSTATANFGYSIFSWSQMIRIQWNFNPNTCVFSFHMASGTCYTS